MSAQTVIEITEDNFDALVNAETPTLVDFCTMVRPLPCTWADDR